MYIFMTVYRLFRFRRGIKEGSSCTRREHCEHSFSVHTPGMDHIYGIPFLWLILWNLCFPSDTSSVIKCTFLKLFGIRRVSASQSCFSPNFKRYAIIYQEIPSFRYHVPENKCFDLWGLQIPEHYMAYTIDDGRGVHDVGRTRRSVQIRGHISGCWTNLIPDYRRPF